MRIRDCFARCGIVLALAGAITAVAAENAGQHKVLTLPIVNGRVPSVGETITVKQGDDWSCTDRATDRWIFTSMPTTLK